jgi:hypothetical protein
MCQHRSNLEENHKVAQLKLNHTKWFGSSGGFDTCGAGMTILVSRTKLRF